MKAKLISPATPEKPLVALINKIQGTVWLRHTEGALLYLRVDGTLEKNCSPGGTLEDKLKRNPSAYHLVYEGDKIEVQF